MKRPIPKSPQACVFSDINEQSNCDGGRGYTTVDLSILMPSPIWWWRSGHSASLPTLWVRAAIAAVMPQTKTWGAGYERFVQHRTSSMWPLNQS